MKEIRDILDRVAAFESGQRAVLATVIEVIGSGYRLPGARMLILPDGGTAGTVSGGCLEADVLERAKLVLETGQSEIFTYDTTENEASVFSLNMGCRGVVRIKLELIGKDSEIIAAMKAAYQGRVASEDLLPPIALLLFGAGTDAIPLVRIAAELGWQVTVYDHRPAFLTAERFPKAQILVEQQPDRSPVITADALTAAVIMTHNYGRDRLILPSLLRSRAFYIGALGPKRRTEQLREELAAEGETFGEDELSRLYAPVGLDIGADTPEAIALSIAAEIQSVLKKRGGSHLRDRKGSIYDRQ